MALWTKDTIEKTEFIQSNDTTFVQNDKEDQDAIIEPYLTTNENNTITQNTNRDHNIIDTQNNSIQHSAIQDLQKTMEAGHIIKPCDRGEQTNNVEHNGGMQHSTINTIWEQNAFTDQTTMVESTSKECNDTTHQHLAISHNDIVEKGPIIKQNDILKERATLALDDLVKQCDTMEECNPVNCNDVFQHTNTMGHNETTEKDAITDKHAIMEKSGILELNDTMNQQCDTMKQSDTKKHMITIEKNDLPCPACSKTFSIQADLDDHLNWHSTQVEQYPNPFVRLDRVNLFACEVCKKGFMEHYKHTSTSCNPCLRVLATIQRAELDIAIEWSNLRLAQHLQNSFVKLRRVKIYPCHLCQSCFLDHSALKDHLKKHIPMEISRRSQNNNNNNNNPLDKPYKCDYCNWCFVLRSTLETHSIIHKPFPHACDCGIGFYKKQDLEGHRKLVHPNAPKNPTVPRLKPESFQIKPQSDSEPGSESDKNEDDYKPSKIRPKLKATVSYIQPKGAKKSRTYTKSKDNLPIKLDTAGRYKCPLCPKTFSHAEGVKTHLYVHIGSKHKCDECPREFPSQAILSKHKDQHAGIKRFSCTVCNKKFTAKSHVKTHMVIHTKEKPFPCNLCPKRFTQSGTLTLHLLRHTGKKDHVCDICQKRFYTEDVLDRHSRVHTGLKPYDCKYCGKAFADPSARRRHEVIHEGTKPHRCTTCPSAFSDYSALVAHKRRHEGIRYTCPLCGKVFNTQYNRTTHHKRVHMAGEKYECDHCGKSFKTKSYLHVHIKNHFPEFVKCEICDKILRNKSSLNNHLMQVHIKNFKYVCEFCGLRFLHGTVKDAHIKRVHDNFRELKYECDYCHKCFYTKDYVRKHIVYKHLGIVCKLCNKRFDCSALLKLHNSEGCIQCPVCFVKFVDNSKMKDHYNLYHIPKSEQQMHDCELCCKQYPSKVGLSRHVQGVHCKTKYSCAHCTTTVFSRTNIRDHIWDKHMISLYCDVCLKRFYSEAEFRFHKSRPCVAKEKVKCQTCEKMIPCKSLSSHMLQHAPKNLECDMCGVKYAYKQSMWRHMRSAHGF